MDFMGRLTEEEEEYMRIIEECTRFEFIDEAELDEYENEMNELLKNVEESEDFEEENARVFVKSLYNH